MAIFTKPTPKDNGVSPQVVRSRFQQILDDYDEAFKRMDHAATTLATLIADTEKVMKVIDRFRVDTIRGIEGSGGVVTPDPTTIEEQVRQFVAPSMQKVENDTH